MKLVELENDATVSQRVFFLQPIPTITSFHSHPHFKAD